MKVKIKVEGNRVSFVIPGVSREGEIHRLTLNPDQMNNAEKHIKQAIKAIKEQREDSAKLKELKKLDGKEIDIS